MFHNLDLLDLSSNKLTYFPIGLNQLTKLRYLDIKANTITDLPDSMDKMISLQTFYAGSNQIRDIPPSLAILPSIKHIDLQGNPIQAIPPTFKTNFKILGWWLLNFPLRTLHGLPDDPLWKIAETYYNRGTATTPQYVNPDWTQPLDLMPAVNALLMTSNTFDRFFALRHLYAPSVFDLGDRLIAGEALLYPFEASVQEYFADAIPSEIAASEAEEFPEDARTEEEIQQDIEEEKWHLLHNFHRDFGPAFDESLYFVRIVHEASASYLEHVVEHLPSTHPFLALLAATRAHALPSGYSLLR